MSGKFIGEITLASRQAVNAEVASTAGERIALRRPPAPGPTFIHDFEPNSTVMRRRMEAPAIED